MNLPISFNEYTKISIPESGGIYYLLGNLDLYGKYPVLYVGKANDLRRRFGEHLNSDDLRIQQQVRFYFYELQPNQLLRDKRERELIQQYNPPINIMLKPKLAPQPFLPKLQKALSPLPLKSTVQPRTSLSDLFDQMDKQNRLREREQKLRTDALLNALKKFS